MSFFAFNMNKIYNIRVFSIYGKRNSINRLYNMFWFSCKSYAAEERVALAQPLQPRFTLLCKANVQRLTLDDLMWLAEVELQQWN